MNALIAKVWAPMAQTVSSVSRYLTVVIGVFSTVPNPITCIEKWRWAKLKARVIKMQICDFVDSNRALSPGSILAYRVQLGPVREGDLLATHT